MPHHTTTLIIDSSQRTSGSNENFTISITPPIKYITKSVLKGFTIPNSLYNINTTNNKLIFTDDSGVDNQITIPPDNYSGEQLADQIELQMINLPSPGHVVDFNTSDFKFTFTYTGATYTITSNTDNALSTLFPLLGFSTTQSGALTYTSDNVANIATPKYISIKSNILTTKLFPNLQNGIESEFIYNVFPNVDFGCMITKQNDTLWEIEYIRSIQLDSIDFRLEDENNNLLDLNGVSWCVILDFQIQ